MSPLLSRRSLRPTLLVSSLALFAVACDDAAATGPSSATAEQAVAVAPVPVAADRADGELPFRLESSAVLLQQEFAPGFGPPTFGRSTFDGRCSAPSDFVIRFALEDSAARLGRFSAVAEHCTTIDFAAGTGTETDGVLVFTAANGDELLDHYAGTNSPVQGFEEQHTFAGGTGRFTHATGEAVGTGTCDQQSGTCAFELEGWIAYDASDRSE